MCNFTPLYTPKIMKHRVVSRQVNFFFSFLLIAIQILHNRSESDDDLAMVSSTVLRGERKKCFEGLKIWIELRVLLTQQPLFLIKYKSERAPIDLCPWRRNMSKVVMNTFVVYQKVPNKNYQTKCKIGKNQGTKVTETGLGFNQFVRLTQFSIRDLVWQIKCM